MKWLIALVLALAMVTPAFAGEDPYIAFVGPDQAANPFYISPKYQQFLYERTWNPSCVTGATFPPIYKDALGNTIYNAGCEQFRSTNPVVYPEICYAPENDNFPVGDYKPNPNAIVSLGNEGKFQWYVRLPKKPSGEINLVIQCGVLKGNASQFLEELDMDAVLLCAGETGERYNGLCSRKPTLPGRNPINPKGLPYLTAVAYPGPYAFSGWSPFHLTAFRNPSDYNPFAGTSAFTSGTAGDLVDGIGAQVLNGRDGVTLNSYSKILLKSCMDKTVVVKMPVTGQRNALGEYENDLNYGDIIAVELYWPSKANTVDVFCHAQSLKVMGIGEALPDYGENDSL